MTSLVSKRTGTGMTRKKQIFLLLVTVTIAMIYLSRKRIYSNRSINDILRNEKRYQESKEVGWSNNGRAFEQMLRNVQRYDQATRNTTKINLLQKLTDSLKKIPSNKTNITKNKDIDEQVNKEWHLLAGDLAEDNPLKAKAAKVRQARISPIKSNLSVLERVLEMTKPPNEKEGYFPQDNSPCPYLGLRKVYDNTSMNNNISCKLHTPKPKDCILANKAYRVRKKSLKCTKEKPINELCVFQETWRSSSHMITSVRCDFDACGGNPVQVIAIDTNYGILSDVDRWHEFTTPKDLEDFIPEYVVKNSVKGLQFCYLRCLNPKREKFIKQILSFPPIMENENRQLNAQNLFNFNIVVLDSVSRAHFYRSLTKTVKTMRNIVNDGNKEATVLDFELLQSTAPYTFYNMRAFMSGKKRENEKQDYGIDLLYGLLQSKGYFTIFQEDSCWYDRWGSLLTNNVHLNKTPDSFEEFAQRWDVYKDRILAYHIDDFGLTHTACDVFRQYGATNQFEQKRTCFSGKPYSEYFLDYATKVFQAYRDSGKRRPVFAYTHLNVGHEMSGKRIGQIDEGLSWYVRSMSKDQDTLTIILSDHGPKTTQFSFHTMEGRAEIYDSLLFMVLPKKIAEKLQMQRTSALFTNQHRLLTTLDLHKAIVSFVESSNKKDQGVFSEVSPQRTCSDLAMRHAVVCKCANWEKLYPDDHVKFTWLAEFGLGKINNAIQEEFMSTEEKAFGFGKCQRLVGLSFRKVRHRVEKGKNVVTMDIIVKPKKEIFEAQFKYPKIPRGTRVLAELSSLRRVSIYSHFRHCSDPQVPLDHCVCNNKKKETRRTSWNWIEVKSSSDILNIIKRTKGFNSNTSIRNLHSNCLLWLSRRHNKRTVAYEIANACPDRKYKVRVTGRSKSKSISTCDLPFSVILRPLTIRFLFSVYHLQRPYGFYIKTSYTALILKK